MFRTMYKATIRDTAMTAMVTTMVSLLVLSLRFCRARMLSSA